MTIFRFDPESHRLPTDSRDYETLAQAIDQVVPGPYIALELGVRAGGSAQMIMERLSQRCKETLFVALDSYGGMPQWHADGDEQILDYTNEMRNKAIGCLYWVAQHCGLNFFFANLRDTDFFDIYGAGIPIYDNSQRSLRTQYNFVFLDGPHATDLVMEEVKFFDRRCIQGAVMVFDDIPNFRMDEIEQWMFSNDWELIAKSYNKAAYRKLVHA